jgi:predicted nucleic acid-binding protein
MMTLPKSLERKIEAFKKAKGATWAKELEGFLDQEVASPMATVLARANMIATQRQNKVSPDTDDDFIIGIAIKAKAHYLVTENTKDIYQTILPKIPPIQVLSVSQALNLWLPKKK